MPEPKVVDPGFSHGNFAIDFGANGYFTYHGFNPDKATIQNVVDAINRFAALNNVNVSASYNPGSDTFTLNNTTGPGQDNRISFDGSNGQAMARFFRWPKATPAPVGAPTTKAAQQGWTAARLLPTPSPTLPPWM